MFHFTLRQRNVTEIRRSQQVITFVFRCGKSITTTGNIRNEEIIVTTTFLTSSLGQILTNRMKRPFKPTASNRCKLNMFLVSLMLSIVLVLGDTALASNDAEGERKDVIHRPNLTSKTASVVADSIHVSDQLEVGVNNNNESGGERKNIIHRPNLTSKLASVVADSFRLSEPLEVGVNNKESSGERKNIIHRPNLTSKTASVVADSFHVSEPLEVGVNNNKAHGKIYVGNGAHNTLSIVDIATVGSQQPTSQPSQQPTVQPSQQPTSQPSMQPSRQPSSQPTRQPTMSPTGDSCLLPTLSVDYC